MFEENPVTLQHSAIPPLNSHKDARIVDRPNHRLGGFPL